MTKQAGFDCDLFIGTALVGLARDVNLALANGEIDATTRDNDGWKDRIYGLGDWSINFNLARSFPNTALSAIQAAFLAKTILQNVRMVDADGYGWQGNVMVSKFDQGEPMEGLVEHAVTFLGKGAPTAITPGS